ncbi:MAG: hypothetical protein HYZ42_03630 [Bacteroidetes bacterium]|nr:hypothetical protein [Bacteroidota bacterium]
MTNIIIPKEQIGAHQLTPSSQSNNSSFLTRLREDFHRAMLIGNSSQSKVKIELQTINGPIAVETTVWASTDACVVLKGGVNIPFKFINSVFLY